MVKQGELMGTHASCGEHVDSTIVDPSLLDIIVKINSKGNSRVNVNANGICGVGKIVMNEY